MARQRSKSQRLKSIVVASLVGLGLVILCGKLDGPSAPLSNLAGAAASEMLELLPSLVPADWQAMQPYPFDSQSISPCPLQMLVSFWPLLQVIAGAA